MNVVCKIAEPFIPLTDFWIPLYNIMLICMTNDFNIGLSTYHTLEYLMQN